MKQTDNLKGNCVDKWISNRLNQSINIFLKLKNHIICRIEDRNNNDYFNTLCYEKDFNDIIKIRDEAQLLVENCNKFLERISEQYSKLN